MIVAYVVIWHIKPDKALIKHYKIINSSKAKDKDRNETSRDTLSPSDPSDLQTFRSKFSKSGIIIIAKKIIHGSLSLSQIVSVSVSVSGASVSQCQVSDNDYICNSNGIMTTTVT